MAEFKKQEPQHKLGEVEKIEVTEVREFLVAYGPSLLIGVGVAVVLALGVGFYQNHRRQQAQQAARLLAGLSLPEENVEAGLGPQKLQMIVDRFPNTPSAPLALLGLAAEQYRSGQYDVAQRSYARFEQHYARHPFRLAADFGRLQCQEAAGQTDAALAGFIRFASVQTNHYLTPLALFGQARCLEQKKQFEAARVVYEDYLAGNPDSPWLGQARSALQHLEQSKRAHARGLPPPGAAARPPPVSPAALSPVPPPPASAAKPPAR
ncbi:MAG: tetratricopeptide repeat protein [Kiritimatiellaeota bacterium]|nr:tetratricopeptide repeat protein [Kiritimatiellota bacterium]